MEVGVSYGTAIKLGLIRAKAEVLPNTAYLLLGSRCRNNCSYCALSRRSYRLARILWPPFPLGVVERAIGRVRFSRVCVQTADYDGMEEDLLELGRRLSWVPRLTASVSPRPRGFMEEMRESGFSMVGIPLDAASRRVFEATRGSGVGNAFTWEGTWKALRDSLSVFGEASTHVIVGLGETDLEVFETLRELHDMHVYVGLFALSPVSPGLKPPDLGRYRTIQLINFALPRDLIQEEDIEFDEAGRITGIRIGRKLMEAVEDGSFAVTSGCPGCDRPFYNESPSGPIYNFPRAPGRSLLRDISLYARVWE